MAIDTHLKRRSVWQHTAVMVLPFGFDGNVELPDRRHILGLYRFNEPGPPGGGSGQTGGLVAHRNKT